MRAHVRTIPDYVRSNRIGNATTEQADIETAKRLNVYSEEALTAQMEGMRVQQELAARDAAEAERSAQMSARLEAERVEFEEQQRRWKEKGKNVLRNPPSGSGGGPSSAGQKRSAEDTGKMK
jgi:hypothetical protein